MKKWDFNYKNLIYAYIDRKNQGTFLKIIKKNQKYISNKQMPWTTWAMTQKKLFNMRHTDT